MFPPSLSPHSARRSRPRTVYSVLAHNSASECPFEQRVKAFQKYYSFTVTFLFLWIGTLSQEACRMHINWRRHYSWKSTKVEENQRLHFWDSNKRSRSSSKGTHNRRYEWLDRVCSPLLSLSRCVTGFRPQLITAPHDTPTPTHEQSSTLTATQSSASQPPNPSDDASATPTFQCTSSDCRCHRYTQSPTNQRQISTSTHQQSLTYDTNTPAFVHHTSTVRGKGNSLFGNFTLLTRFRFFEHCCCT